MIKRRLKWQYILLLIGLFVILPVFTVSHIVSSNLQEEPIEPDTVSEEIIEHSQPVINETTKVISPYLDQSVQIGKKYYDYQGKEEDQINSIIKHDDTYLQNSGIDYVAEKEFEVVAILNGTVTNIKEDENVGKTIEIKHEDGKVSIYQSLGQIKVKKGDIVNQGQVIATSGTNELDKELGNHLHFEIYDNGGPINPESYLNTEISLKKEN